MLYGIRHDYKPYAKVSMIDINWKSYIWATYLEKVRAHNPALAMVPDFEDISQLDNLLMQIEAIRSVGAQILVCPKFVGASKFIPADCRIAVSVETTYAGFEPAPDELKGRELHLLGGHPDQQAYMIKTKYAGSKVASVDGNILGMKAAFGQVWARMGGWKRSPGMATQDIAIQSALNVIDYLGDAAPTIRLTRRVQRSAQLSLW